MTSQKVARPGRKCLPDAIGLVNQEVAIELVDEEPTEEMISARERFWEKVFAELLPVNCSRRPPLIRGADNPLKATDANSLTDRQLADAMKIESSRNKPSISNKISEQKFRIEDAAAIIGISPSGVRLLLNTKKLGYYQSGKRRIIGERHLTEYLTKIERNRTKATIY